MIILLVGLPIIGGVASVLTIYSFVAERGKAARRRIVARVRRRPVAPRTNVHLEPDELTSHWSQRNAPNNRPGILVAFQMRCTATNLTPGLDVQIVGVELRGVRGEVAWASVTSWRPGEGLVHDATLAPQWPIGVMLVVEIEREGLPPGPHLARMVIRDHLGHRHRSRKVRFQDATKWATPPGPEAPS